MATQTADFGMAPVPASAEKSSADRRREPRFGAEGEVTVVVNEGLHQQELIATLMDFSLHGLRVRIPVEVQQGVPVRVFFSWGEVATNVKWVTSVPNGFDIGLQLF
jgi:hypothetical protein